MKQFIKKIAATSGAILIALTLIVINADQALAKDKARKGTKVRAGGTARAAVDIQVGHELTPLRKRKPDAFSIDIGTSENLKLQAEGARRKTTKRMRR